MKRKNRAFTILELLVVVAIMAIIAIVAIPNFIGAIERSKESQDIAEINSVTKAANMYYMEHGAYPTLQGDQPTYGAPCNLKFDALVPNYLDHMPHFSYWFIDNEGKVYHTQYTLGTMNSATLTGLSNKYTYKLDGVEFTGNSVNLSGGKVLSITDDKGRSLPDITLNFKGTIQDPNDTGHDSKEEVNNPPKVEIVMTAPEIITTQTKITWSYNFTDSNHDTIQKEEWEGNLETYTKPGDYNITLRVQDKNGVWSETAEKKIHVYGVDTVNWGSGGLTYKPTDPSWYYGSEATVEKYGGKWYWEIKIKSQPNYGSFGIQKSGMPIDKGMSFGYYVDQYGILMSGQKINGYKQNTYGTALAPGDILGFALDMTNQTISIYRNGIDLGVMYSNFAIPVKPAFSMMLGEIEANFGASTFTYNVPEGFLPYMIKDDTIPQVGWKSGGTTFTSTGGSYYQGTEANLAKKSGKWYWELEIQQLPAAAGFGIQQPSQSINNAFVFGYYNYQYAYTTSGGKANNYNGVAYGPAPQQGDVLGFALDMDNKEIRVYRNGTDLGIMYSGITLTEAVPAFAMTSGRLTANFGNSAFKYSIPDGYKAYAMK